MNQIWSIRLPSQKWKLLQPVAHRSVFISPDGVYLAFDNHSSELSAPDELRLMRRSAPASKPIVSGLWGRDILWSPDSALLLLPALDGAASGYIVDPSSNHYWTWRACGLERRPTFVRWTADGRGIFAWDERDKRGPSGSSNAVLRCDFDGTVSVVEYVPTRGRERYDLLANSVSQLRPQLSPDEKMLLYPWERDRRRVALTVLPPKGDPGDAVADALSPAEVALWSPDSMWIGWIEVESSGGGTFIKNLREQVALSLDVGNRHPRMLQWWAPGPPAKVDTRAIVRAALGEGAVFTPPLEMPVQEIAP